MLESLKNKCLNCKNCSLCETRHNVVFGVGNEKTDIMFIGEGPGEQEDLKGEPFVGKAGMLLDKLLNSIHLDRHKNIYIANIVKCRPPQNRDPKPEEQDMCITWLYEQIRIIEPKIIVCLGRIAAAKMIDPDIKIMKDHGKIYRKNGLVMMPILHPAAILRNQHLLPETFGDFLHLRDELEKIRG
ncbi:MAG: uracil-DNA glycosylase [Clostridia bacterium]|nr:uracil-DNA glycosylase [Clostridia bacterium]